MALPNPMTVGDEYLKVMLSQIVALTGEVAGIRTDLAAIVAANARTAGADRPIPSPAPVVELREPAAPPPTIPIWAPPPAPAKPTPPADKPKRGR